MLGITVPDAVVIGTLIVALLAGWRGAKAGEAAKAQSPPLEPGMAMIGAAIVDRQTLQDLTAAVVDLAACIREAIDTKADARQHRMDEAVDALQAAAGKFGKR